MPGVGATAHQHRHAAGVELTDVSGTPVRARPAQTKKTESFGSFFEPVDWDDDGDLDLLIGCFDGSLELRLSTVRRARSRLPDTQARLRRSGHTWRSPFGPLPQGRSP